MSEEYKLPPPTWDEMSLFEQLATMPEETAENILTDLIRRGIDPIGAEVMLRPEQLAIVQDYTSWISVFSAGRGSGKTKTGAAWTNDRAKKYPGCRIILLGRTVADVRDVMVLGESGIIETASEDFKPVYVPSKRRVEWPNGSSAMTFSGDQPSQLRGPQGDFSWCLSPGTPVMTPRGEIPIEDISVGEYVVTPEGSDRVTAVGSRVSDIWSLRLVDGRVLEGSAEHPIATERGWVPLSEVSISDNVFVWADEKSLVGYSGRTGTSCGTPNKTVRKEPFTNTVGSTKSTMGSFWGVPTTYTTETETQATTELKTYSGYPLASTLYYMGNIEGRAAQGPPVQSIECARIAGVYSSVQAGERHRNTHDAMIAQEQHILHTNLSTRRSGLITKERASTVGVLSLPRSPHKGRATNQLLTIAAEGAATPVGRKGYVYNLTVENSHHFFANGILTHNCDELAAFPITPDSSGATAWDNCILATRLGDQPQILVTTTPKRTGVMKGLYKQADEDERVTLHTTSTLANRTNLSPEYLKAVFDRYAGTHLEQQELFGVLIGDAPGALWKSSDITIGSVPDDVKVMTVIGVDPAVEAGGDNTGIVIVKATRELDMNKRRAWVVDDQTMSGAPDEWAKRVYDLWKAHPDSVVVVEGNQGGQLLKMVLHQLDATMPVAIVKAIRSKAARAEPVVMAYRKDRVIHTDHFPLLEEEMTGWEPDVSKWSPGSVDALVWAITSTLVDDTPLLQYLPAIPVKAHVDMVPAFVPAFRANRHTNGLAVAPWRTR